MHKTAYRTSMIASEWGKRDWVLTIYLLQCDFLVVDTKLEGQGVKGEEHNNFNTHTIGLSLLFLLSRPDNWKVLR